MLNNYAAFLGMNPDPLLLRFAEGLQARLSARQATQQITQAAARRRKRRWLPRRLRRLLSGDVLIGGVLTVFLGLVVLWISIRIFAITSTPTEATPTAPSIAEVLLATPSPTPLPTGETPTQAAPTPGLPTQPPATDPATGLMVTSNPGEGLEIHISVRQRAWLQVVVDGEVEFQDRVIPGSVYPFTGQSSIEVTTSSGSAVQVYLNGADQGVMGSFGQVVRRLYGAEGLITPTPSVTPTPAPTTPVTPTPPAATELPGQEPPALP
jgi:cytoskeletal protein RodZ